MKRFLTIANLKIMLFVFVAYGMIKLVIESIAEKGVSDFNRLLSLAIVAVAVLVFVRTAFPKDITREDLAEPKRQLSTMNSLFAVFAVISAAIGLMAPRSAVESRSGLLEQLLINVSNNVQETRANTEELLDGQEQIKGAVGIGAPSLGLTNIGGRWGEESCAATYDFAVKDRALIVASAKSANGMGSMRWVFTINADGNRPGASGEKLAVIEASEAEGFFKGQSVSFSYATNGVTERLTWDGRDERQPTLVLRRC